MWAMRLRRTLAAAVLAAAAVAVGAPAAHAQVPIPGALPVSPATPLGTGDVGATGCGPAHGSEGQGGTGSSETTVCAGTGLVFIGPTSLANTTIGPTIITAGPVTGVVTSNGSSAVGVAP
jgi:hypothetical protein